MSDSTGNFDPDELKTRFCVFLETIANELTPQQRRVIQFTLATRCSNSGLRLNTWESHCPMTFRQLAQTLMMKQSPIV